jgi:hypothetical protein
VLLLLVPVVLENGPQLRVLGGVDALVVPVDRLQLLDDRDDRPVAFDGLRPEAVPRLV